MAGWAFSHTDVASLAPRLPPERVDLGRYTLLAHHRTGAAAACRVPFSTDAGARAKLTVEVPLEAGGSRATAGPVPLVLRGPGDVLGIDPRQIIRRYPEPGTGNAEPSDLVHCEFDRSDLPWLFTPTAPQGGHLPPWIRLVVVPEQPLDPPAGRGLPQQVTVPVSELPPAQEAWAWAHAQVIGPAVGEPGIASRLDPGNPALNLSRLLCPRRLEPRRSYRAMLVPTFEAGRQAGLGETAVVETLQWSWPADGGDGTVQLPVYDSWTFSTGDDGDFETLARRLRPVAAPPGTGRRLVATDRPGLCLEPGGDGRPREVLGPLVRPADTPSGTADPAAPGVWSPEAGQALAGLLDAADSLVFDPANDEDDPELAPPLYGGTHRAVGLVPAEGVQPAWLRQLNLDPAHRIAAGLGAAVARMDAEDLMASAWGQLPDVLEANEALRWTQFSRYLSRRFTGHLDALDDVNLLAVTQRGQARVLQAPGRTVRGAVGDSATPVAATAAALRRLARPAGPLRRFGAAGSQVLLGDGEQMRDWVLPLRAPDATERLSADGIRLLVEAGAADAADLAQVLAERSVLDELADGARPVLGHGADALSSFITQRLMILPPWSEVQGVDFGNTEDLRLIPLVFAVREVLPDLLAALDQRDQVLLGEDAVQRHDLSRDEPTEVPGAFRVASADIREKVQAVARELGTAAGPWERGDHAVRQFLDELDREGRQLPEQVEGIYEDCLMDSPEPTEPARRLLVPGDLHLRELFDPARTLARRIRQRIPGLAETLPGWLDNGRFDPVMAAPAFRHPMYEALHRLDPQWLLPGVGAIEPREMVTTLETNPVFVEAFLIGLNHEFARELVWRGYPTDGRGTCFRSFWTRSEELRDPIHRMSAGDLGSHLSGAASGKLVYVVRGELVRRYPQLHAQVVRQASVGRPIRYTAIPVPTLFQATVGHDMLLIGVDLVDRDILAGPDQPDGLGQLSPVPPPGSFWLTLSEHVGEPRFGLDEEQSGGADRDDLSWQDWAPTGGHLPVGTAPNLRPALGTALSSAVVAWLLFQLPARAGFRARRLMLEMGDPA